MAEISLKDTPGASIVKTVADGSNWVKDGLAILKEVNSLISNINNNPLVQRFANRGAGETIISSPGANIQGSSPALPPPSNKAGSTAKPPAFDNKQIEAYFSTPEGIKQIIEAIDQFSPLVGENATLKDVKSLLSQAVGGENVQTERGKIKEKKDPGKKGSKAIYKGSKKTKK